MTAYSKKKKKKIGAQFLLFSSIESFTLIILLNYINEAKLQGHSKMTSESLQNLNNLNIIFILNVNHNSIKLYKKRNYESID